jgi:hypothetical protein
VPKYRVVFKAISNNKNGVGGIMIEEDANIELSHGDLILRAKCGCITKIYARGYWEYIENMGTHKCSGAS